MPRVAVVTDSTSSLDVEVAESVNVQVVPVQVIVDGQAFDEGIQMTSARVAEALRESASVTTSRPTPIRFIEVYEALIASGADAIVSVHLSGELSSTYDSAVVAARDSGLPVEVVDSRSIGMGLGYAVLDAADAASSGSDAREVAMTAAESSARNQVFFYVDTLEYLRRGGRIGSAQRLIGQALSVKPILQLTDGHVEALEKVRTRGRAMTRLLEIAVAAASAGPCRVAVEHLDAKGLAALLAERIQDRVPNAQLRMGEVGAVVGTHVGPGLVSVTVSPEPRV